MHSHDLFSYRKYHFFLLSLTKRYITKNTQIMRALLLPVTVTDTQTYCVVAIVSPRSLILSLTALPPPLPLSLSFSFDLLFSLLLSFFLSSSCPSGPWSFLFLCFLCFLLCFFLGEVEDDSTKEIDVGGGLP